MFQIDASWEISADEDAPKAAAGSIEKPCFHLVELASNAPLYHLAVVFREDEEVNEKLRLYRFDNLLSAVESVADEASVFVRLTQETPFEFYKKPELREIFAVFAGQDESGNEILVFDSDAGRFRVGDTSDRYPGTLLHARLLWQSVAYRATNGQIVSP